MMNKEAAASDLVRKMSQDRLALYAASNMECRQHSIVLLGDSLVEYFPIYEIYRGDKCIYNRGIAGSTTYDVLANLTQSVFPLKPQKIFLEIGSNDLLPGVPANEPDSIASRIMDIAGRLVRNHRETQVYIQSVYPIHTADHPKIYREWLTGRTNKNINTLNHQLEKACSGTPHRYLDVHSHLLDANGQLDIAYTLDGIHVNYQAYKIILSVLERNF